MNEERVGYIRLYKNHKNKIGYWEGWVEGTTLIMQYATGIYDLTQRKEEHIAEGKQGRTAHQQALFRLKSRINSKLDGGYVLSFDEAKLGPTDAAGLVKPMLAQKFKDYRGKLDPRTAYVQLKYNGHRALIMKKGGRVFAISRNGKEIPGIPHILSKLENIPEGAVLDGEIYRHGWKLQYIASTIKRYQKESQQLKFICFDYVSKRPFVERFKEASSYCDNTLIVQAPTRPLDQVVDLHDSLRKSTVHGYEGLILRLGEYPYEDGRRSKSLLKLKEVQDDEFQVVDILPSKDGWGILVCKLPAGGTFKVSAPGTLYEKELVLKNKDSYIGKLVTVEFAEYTADNVPFQPIATRFRTDL